MRLWIRSLSIALATACFSILFCSVARAETVDCVCKIESCGNGVTPGNKGKVYRNIPQLSIERMFGPARTGAAKTGWECERTLSGIPAPSGPPSAKPVEQTRDLYTCTCAQETCGGGDTMPGRSGERQELLSKGYVSTRFQPGGFLTTGWQCVNKAGELYQPAEPDPRQRYTCTCMQSACGGKDGFVPGERGQQHNGVSLARVVPKYGAGRAGAAATGWVCKAEAPPPPPPKYTCTCNRELCGGQDTILEADKGQRNTGVPATQLQASYGPERTGPAATGWSCVEEPGPNGSGARPAAPSAWPQPSLGPAVSAGSVPVFVAVDPGYSCRCEGYLGCGVGGAPYAKKGEVREGVPASQISTLYHSDKPGGWVCSVMATATAGVVQMVTDPGYVCRCAGYLGCGSGGAPYAKKGEVREGVPASQISTLYHSDTPGGWVCTTK